MEEQHRLLLIACSADGDEIGAAFDRFLTISPIDQVDHVSSELLPLLSRRLEFHGIDHPKRRDLAYFYRKTWHKNQVLLYSAAPVFAWLDEQDIPAVVLKGGAMASSLYYDDLGVRPLFDFDILVPPDRIGGAVEWAVAHGWTVTDTAIWNAQEYIDANHAVDLRMGDGALDLHHGLLATDRSPHLDEVLIETSVLATIGSRSVQALAPTMQLMHTLAHSKPEGLRHLADALFIIERYGDDLDWAAICDQVILRRSIAGALENVDRLGEVKPEAIPDHVAHTLRKADRHWSDWKHQDQPVHTRTAGAKAFASGVAQRSRGEGMRGTARVTLLLARQYGHSADTTVGRKFISFATRGPRGARPTP